ncbi:PEP/pyruvate-binding domain-containing protein [Promethearchaeum syntrophicum]|uniref:PEP/pyruvate-binding domain-containing protein n=1 Tax=Promethearchaeum syntrophicum TaxID=2594042 RepID=A0A5B9DA80_9ARCH|nr:PEP/pyruvate-binding domain-containing protein [Candidatus Prometheoarchaeum syntrophicum]QEE16178.1 phosphoenolpyruvate synthase [Candidatus Prometheoarchaeum syntrophicum]
MDEFSVDESQFDYKPKYRIFHSLMKNRIKEILLVSSAYDNFILEEDGRLSDQIYAEFHDLNLRTIPHITRVSSAKGALARLKENEFDLVVTMRKLFDSDPFEFGKQIKEIQDIPVVLLLTSLSDINFIPDFTKSKEGIDLTFLWNGDSAIFISLTKLLEDRMNIKEDTENGMVRVIIIIEDNIRFYSVYLPLIYSEIMRQIQLLIQEGVNDYYRLLQMKARPKIILTHTYEEAMKFYEEYKENVIGIISDIEFPRNNKINRNAGIDFIKSIRKEAPTIPAILQSANLKCEGKAYEIQAHFIYKKSKTLLEDIRKFMVRSMGFGDFIFRLNNGEEVGKASNLREFKEQIETVPVESLYYHATYDNFSGWLMARGEFRVASIIKAKHVDDYEDDIAIRKYLAESVQYLLVEQKNIITEFRRVNYNPDSNFIRLRPGSLGGKGRGLAFLMFLLNPYNIASNNSVEINIPQTIAIGTEEFDYFMTSNNLYEISSSQIEEEELIQIFKRAKLSKTLRADLKFILKDWKNHPIAIRSSSIVEDSQFQPFAGVFGTYMISNQDKDINSRLNRVFEAIKMVYASTFSKAAKANSEALNLRIDEIKMGVIIQKVVGLKYEASNHFYPNYSGTASSFNYYTVGKMESRDGNAFIALGLGRTIVNGGLARMFCPTYPKLNIYSDVHERIQHSQKNFYAIDLSKKGKHIINEESYLSRLSIADAKKDGTLYKIADSYNRNDNVIQSGYWDEAHTHPIITFDQQILYDKSFPLPKIIKDILELGEKTMGCPVEIEFAGNFRQNEDEKHSLNLLQIRPSTEIPMKELGKFDDIVKEDILARSINFSGNGIYKNIQDIVYIKSSAFSTLKTVEMVSEIDEFNKKLITCQKPYLLIVFGRLGSFDKHVGIPVKEYNISNAKVIIETGKEGFQIEQSLGSHFFQNMVSTKTGFLHIKHDSENQFLDWNWLKKQKITEEKQFFTHVELSDPLTIILDGRKKIAIVKKPEMI